MAVPKAFTPARLPEKMRDGGASVAVAIPLEDGSVAHRPEWKFVDARNRRGSTYKEQVLVPRCQDTVARGVTYAPFSAGWADEMGAHACPNAKCFGTAS